MKIKRPKKRKYNSSIDVIRIILKPLVPEIKKSIQTEEIKKLCQQFELKPASEEAKQAGYLSQITVHVPKANTFPLMAESLQHIPYKISYLEIARDRLYKDNFHAERRTEWLLKHVRKKYTSEFEIIETGGRFPHDKSGGKLPGRTGYWGEGNFGLRVYHRISKTKSKPCARTEFFFKGSVTIREKTGLSRLENFTGFKKGECFRELWKKYVVFEEINHAAHGRFAQGVRHWKHHVGIIKNGSRSGQELEDRLDLASQQVADFFKCPTAPQLRDYYVRKRKEYTEQRKKGKKLTPLKEKIANLTANKINSFFKQIDRIDYRLDEA